MMFYLGASLQSCRLRLGIDLVPMTVFLLIALVGTACAEYQITPRISVSEEYNDNLFETETDRKTDYITRVQPGLAFRYNAPFWDWDLSYGFDYRHYAKDLREDESTYNFSGTGKIRLIDNLLFLDVSDTYSRVSLDSTRTSTNDSLFVNQTDQNVFTASPYFVLHPSAAITVRTGYVYTKNWYEDPTAESIQRHSGFLDVSHEMTSKLFLNSKYQFDRELSDTTNFNRHEAFIGPRFEYAERSFISAQGGVTVTEYDGTNTSNTSPYWNVGITHTQDTVTATLSSTVKNTADPVEGATREIGYAIFSIRKDMGKGNISLNSSYTEFYDVNPDVRTTERFMAGMNCTYEIMEHLNGRLGFTFEHSKYLADDQGTTKRYYVDTGISYSFGNNLTVGLNYNYANFESAQIATDNMQSHRVIIEISKVFNQ